MTFGYGLGSYINQMYYAMQPEPGSRPTPGRQAVTDYLNQTERAYRAYVDDFFSKYPNFVDFRFPDHGGSVGLPFPDLL